MSDDALWKPIRLKTITTKIGSGATPRGGKESYQHTGLSLIRSLNVYDFHFEKDGLAYIDDAQAEQLASVTVEPADILLNITGASVARCCMVPQEILPARVNQHVAIIRVKKDIADPAFVFYCLNSTRYKSQLLGLAQGGATREALTKETIENFEVDLPALSTQKQLSSVLRSYDNLIENNTRRITILEEMAHMIYREWFVNFRFPGYENVKMVESEIGQIPDGWIMVELAALYKTGSGGTPSRKVDEYFGGSIPWVKTKELNDGFIIDTEEKITESGLKCSSAKLFPQRTVLMAMYGATIGKLGMLTSAATCNQACCAMSENVEPFGAEYLFLTLKHKRDDIIGLRMGAAQQNISQEVIRSIRILRPRGEVVSSFNQLAGPIFDDLRVLTQKNINLRKTRDLLLPKLISGEISPEYLEAETVAQTV